MCVCACVCVNVYDYMYICMCIHDIVIVHTHTHTPVHGDPVPGNVVRIRDAHGEDGYCVAASTACGLLACTTLSGSSTTTTRRSKCSAVVYPCACRTCTSSRSLPLVTCVAVGHVQQLMDRHDRWFRLQVCSCDTTRLTTVRQPPTIRAEPLVHFFRLMTSIMGNPSPSMATRVFIVHVTVWHQ